MSDSKLEIYQRATNRRLDSLEKSIDLTLKILTKFVDDMEPDIEALKTSIQNSRETQRDIHKEIQKDLKQVQFAVENKVDDVQKTLDSKEILTVPAKKIGIIKKLLKQIKGGGKQ